MSKGSQNELQCMHLVYTRRQQTTIENDISQTNLFSVATQTS